MLFFLYLFKSGLYNVRFGVSVGAWSSATGSGGCHTEGLGPVRLLAVVHVLRTALVLSNCDVDLPVLSR